MNELTLVLFVSLIILIAALTQVYFGWSTDMTYVRSSSDKHRYLVRNLPDKQRAADQLASLRIRLTKFVKKLAKAFPKNEAVQRLNVRFKPKNLSESSGSSRYTSYSVAKGARIALCLRQRDHRKQLIDDNTIIFVTLHELAHVMTLSIGHTSEFWDNFKFLLEFADQQGDWIYHPYHQLPKSFCGIMINDTPYKR